MKLTFVHTFIFVLALSVISGSCDDGFSVYDPNYEPSQPQPVINNITPVDGYLAGVDSVIITGQNFAADIDSLIVNFGGSPGIIHSATNTELIVRPGTIWGENLEVRVAIRGHDFFNDSYQYTLFQPFGVYPGLLAEDEPSAPVAVDDQNNIYSIITSNSVTRYRRIAPDGTITTDDTQSPADGGPIPNTMRFTSYSSLIAGPGGQLLMAQQSLQAIFQKTFGDGLREGIWAVSSTSSLDIRDMVFDDNGYLWVVGINSDDIHRFDVASKAETKFPFEGQLSSVAYNNTNSELFVGGVVDSATTIWKFSIDGSGNIGTGELYFDFEEHYSGSISSMIFASNGELLITTGPEESGVEKPSIVRIFPSGRHEELYEGMIKAGAYSITWRDDNLAVVAVQGTETSINFLDMYDRTRSGIFGF